MNNLNVLKLAYLTWLSRPAHERAIYQAIQRLAPRSIIEMGVGMGVRAQRMIAVAGRYRPDEQIRYTGIDLFEARAQPQTGLTLKAAHKQLKATGANARLIPGDPLSALARSANSLLSSDLLVISADQDRDSLQKSWFYVPRMLHEKSLVLIEEGTGKQAKFRLLTAAQVERLATEHASTRRAA